MARSENIKAIIDVQGERLKEIRKHYGVTTVRFSKEIGLERSALWRCETGKMVIPTQALYGIWERYKVSPGMVLGIEKLRF